MTAAELRALIQAASPMPWDASECGDVWSAGRQVCDYVPNEPDAALIVALRNNAERFAELMAAEEARAPKAAWRYSETCDIHFLEGTGQKCAPTVWLSTVEKGKWSWNVDEKGGFVDTLELAKSAVEDAVRAGR